jgi:hypothetical protein
VEECYTDDGMAVFTQSVVEALREHHVTDVRWARGWEGRPVIWLVTETDAEKSAVAEQGCFVQTVRELLAEAGVPGGLASRARVTVESNESVARKWWSSWRSRMEALPPDVEQVMETATRSIVGALHEHGVIDVHWFLAYEGYPVVWLVTETDVEKAAVAGQGFFRPTVQQLLADAGVPTDLAARAGVTVESNESVDREWDGKWHFAMR